MKNILLTAFCCLLLQAARTQDFYPEEYVVTASSLNLRESPDINSKKVASLSRGTVVQFVGVAFNGEYVEVDSIFNRWYKVKHQNTTGYVFGAYVCPTVGLYYENEFFDEELPPLNWYGVYARDSFSDEIRKIEVRTKEEYNEFYGGNIKVLKTNQKQSSKFIIGSVRPFRTGYAGPLGVFEVTDHFVNNGLGPGATYGISPGYPEGDTTAKATYVLTATGCAEFVDDYVQLHNYKLLVLDYSTQPATRQDITQWVTPEVPEISPTVSLSWYGDLDGDNRPDALIDDSPYEVSGRTSLFLSSKARPGEFLRKVCEHFWPGD
ncbi:MAG: SH3 domain-containing protein [Saprospiraceae bacterium]